MRMDICIIKTPLTENTDGDSFGGHGVGGGDLKGLYLVSHLSVNK